MPVDEADLILKVNSLVALRTDRHEQIRKIEQTLESLQSILLEDGNRKTDGSTGTQMSATRRQEVYDACIAVANELLGTTAEED